MLTPWYELYRGLFEDEVSLMDKEGLVLDETLLNKSREVKFTGAINVNGESYHVEINYPAGYPWVRPEVYVPAFRQQRHQQPYDGNLCLLEYYPNVWRSDLNGGYLLERAKEWIRNQLLPEGDPDKWINEVDAPEPKQFYTPGHPVGLLVPKEFLNIPAGVTGTFKMRFNLKYMNGIVTSLHYFGKEANGNVSVTAEYSSIIDTMVIDASGYFLSTDVTPPYFKDVQDLVKWAESQGITGLTQKVEKSTNLNPLLKQKGFGKIIAIRYMDEGQKKGNKVPYWVAYSLPHFWVKERNKPPVVGQWFTISCYNSDKDNLFNRAAGWETLGSKVVTVVGLGAIGSQIAVELVRAGIKKMYLIDPDIFSPGNIVRHVLSLEDVGLPKVGAMYRLLKKINPFVEIVPYGFRIGSNQIELEEFARMVNDSDIVVSATGENSVDRVINEVCLQTNKVAVYAWASMGAWGGTVIRTRPEGGCFDCHSYWDSAEDSVMMPEDPNGELFYETSCAHPSFPGVGFDTATVAMAAARLASRTLLAMDGAPDVTYDWLLLRNRNINDQDDLITLKRPLLKHSYCWRHS